MAQSPEEQPLTAVPDGVATQATDDATKANINWSSVSSFDTGYESSVAMHPSGLIVEMQ